MKILLYAPCLNSAGGLNVGLNLTSKISVNHPSDEFVLICPNNALYQDLDYPNLKIRLVPPRLNKKYFRPLFNMWVKNCIQEELPDVIFNLCNIPLRTNHRQLVLLHWPYAVYPENEIWNRMNTSSYLNRRIRLFFFKRNLKFANRFTVQTKVMQERLEKRYGIENIDVVPSSVLINKEVKASKREKIRSIKDIKTPKFLCITRYYPHKNLEILLELAQLIKKQEMDYKIILTIDPHQERATEKLSAKIKEGGLQDILINIGTVGFDEVPYLFSITDAFLLPTLMESFGLTYLEAMYFGKPIFTSDLDFANEVCKDAAVFFDPFSAEDILVKMKLIENNRLITRNLKHAKAIMDQGFMTWDLISKEYGSTLHEMTV